MFEPFQTSTPVLALTLTDNAFCHGNVDVFDNMGVCFIRMSRQPSTGTEKRNVEIGSTVLTVF